MTIRIRCRCGEVLHADAQHVGRKVRCRCGRTHTVRLPRPAAVQSGASGGWRAAGRRLFAWPRLATGVGTGAADRAPHSRQQGLAARFPEAARWTRRTAFGALALSLLATLVLWVFGDRTTIGTVLLFSGRWVLLVPLAPVALAAALFDRRSFGITAATALIILFGVMGLRLGVRAGAPVDEPDGRLRIATFNAAGNFDAVRELVALMQRWEMDVALVQECPFRSGQVEASIWTLYGGGALCIISRHPVTVRDRMNLDDIMPRNRTYGGTSMALRYDVTLPDRTVTVANVHLETARRGLRGLRRGELGRMTNNLMLRRIESGATAQWVGPERDDVVVAGDFNMPIESTIYRAAWGDFDNAFSRVGRGFGFTRDNGWIRVRIDHVLAGRNWRANRAWVGPAIGSDHRPVFAELLRAAD